MPDSRPSWHHWPVALAAILFYLIGTCDFALNQIGLDFYTNRFTEKQAEFLNTMPMWLTLVWALGTIGGLTGALLLWARNSFSVLWLFTAFAALVLLTVWTLAFTRPTLLGAMGVLGLYLMVTTCALAFLFYVYARWERTARKLS
ncbi:hypothetical protein [Qingshengfaniella alkalisoli]|uniref:Uncharacterized protein n=1 Tax=Qingshengfaniella alkalisoli TaxID=2599296 RepID=A0A5B8ITS8_9RHOB|nr:hypothetical protein [Qingshengfaniella alkalisoli]QDY69014.1 hypothetical protein FPZ52_04810 [Qingshengfaniella alkalisoli]